MSYPKDKIRVAFADKEVQGIGPNGRGCKVPAGAYIVAELDGMESGILMVEDPTERGVLLAMVQESSVEIKETVSGLDPIGWATYHRQNPDVLASWGEQNGRMAPAGH